MKQDRRDGDGKHGMWAIPQDIRADGPTCREAGDVLGHQLHGQRAAGLTAGSSDRMGSMHAPWSEGHSQ